MPTAEIITIGTELLLGETVDTNTRFIARTLRGLGVNLFRAVTIGDNAGRIAEVIREAMDRAEIVITTGGLGPTVDDPTRQAVAEAVGVEVEYRPELWEQVERTVRRYGRIPGENQKRQAYVPHGALAIENPVGTAPAFIVETDRNAVIALPGVPREMEYLLTRAVVPYLQKRFDLHEIIKIRTLHTAGLGESLVDEKVGDLETLANPTVGLTAHSGVIDIRIAAKAGTEAEADGMIAAIERDIRTRLGEAIYGADDDTLDSAALAAASRDGWTLGCVEAGGTGTLLERLARSGSPVYRGGDRLEVPADALPAALQATLEKLSASAGLGIHIFIQGEQMDVTLVLQTPAAVETRHLTYGGHPANVPRWAANMALDWLRRTANEVR
jgi:competence/damage-inducible protein CinA-like protein